MLIQNLLIDFFFVQPSTFYPVSTDSLKQASHHLIDRLASDFYGYKILYCSSHADLYVAIKYELVELLVLRVTVDTFPFMIVLCLLKENNGFS